MAFDYGFMPAIILGIGISIIWLSLRRVLSLSAKIPRKGRRVVERVVLSLAIVLAVAVTASSTFNAITIWYYARATCAASGLARGPRDAPGVGHGLVGCSPDGST